MKRLPDSAITTFLNKTFAKLFEPEFDAHFRQYYEIKALEAWLTRIYDLENLKRLGLLESYCFDHRIVDGELTTTVKARYRAFAEELHVSIQGARVVSEHME